MDKDAKKWPYYSGEKAKYDDLRKRTAILLKMAEGIEKEDLEKMHLEKSVEPKAAHPYTPF